MFEKAKEPLEITKIPLHRHFLLIYFLLRSRMESIKSKRFFKSCYLVIHYFLWEETKNMFKKLRKNEKGFTLAELLIVVAIIGVLVAISIPIFTAQLEKAREATDLANLRAAKAAAVSAYLSDDKIDDKQLGSTQEETVTLYYDAAAGKLVTKSDGLDYGKGTKTVGSDNNKQLGYEPDKAATKFITVTITPAGDVTVSFNQT